jgi:hypothetical protein
MGLPKFRFNKTAISQPEAETAAATSNSDNMTTAGEEPKTAGPETIGPANVDLEADELPNKDAADLPTETAQAGVQDVEAVTLTWSKPSLIAVFILYVESITDLFNHVTTRPTTIH